MNNWKNYTINLGNVKANSSTQVKFESNLPLEISRVSPDCASCTKFLDYKDNILTLKFDAPTFPLHLQEPVSVIDKGVTVYYEDGSTDRLKFVGFLKR